MGTSAHGLPPLFPRESATLSRPWLAHLATFTHAHPGLAFVLLLSRLSVFRFVSALPLTHGFERQSAFSFLPGSPFRIIVPALRPTDPCMAFYTRASICLLVHSLLT